MSSTVSLPPSFAMPAQPSVTANLILSSVPPELQSLPAGTELPAVLIPPATSADLPVLSVTLPDGTEIAIPVKLNKTPAVSANVTLKIVGNEAKDLLAVQIRHTPQTAAPAPAPDISVPAAPVLTDAPPAFEPPLLEAVPLRPLPPSAIGKLPPEIVGTVFESSKHPLPPELKISFVILPETEEPHQTAAPNAPENITRPALPENPIPSVPLKTDPVGNVSSAFQKTIFENVTLLQNPKTDFIPTETEQKIYEAVGEILKPPAATKEFSPVLLREAAPSKTPVARPPVLPETAETGTPDTAPVRNAEARESRPIELKPNLLLKGTVFSLSPDEQTMIATKLGVLALTDKVQLPPLSVITMKITDVKLPMPSENEFLPAERNTWTILNHALESLKQTDETAYETVKNLLPQTGNKLPALMLSFMQAASEGASLRSWLGEANVAALQRTPSGANLLKRLEREFSTSAKKATDGQNSWKGWDIPLLSGSVVEPVSLFLQRPPEDAEKHEKYAPIQNAVRFVLDMNLTRLGKMQMEGIAGRQKRRFDLTIRHQSDLPPEFEPTVRSLFIKTLDALSYAGNLKIAKTEEFIDLRPENESGAVRRGVLV